MRTIVPGLIMRSLAVCLAANPPSGKRLAPLLRMGSVSSFNRVASCHDAHTDKVKSVRAEGVLHGSPSTAC